MDPECLAAEMYVRMCGVAHVVENCNNDAMSPTGAAVWCGCGVVHSTVLKER